MKKITQVLLFTVLIITLSSCGTNKSNDSTQEKQDNVQKVQDNTQKDISKKIEKETQADVKEISQKLLNGEMTDEQAKKAMMDSLDNSKTFKDQLEKSKYEIPRMLEYMKSTKDCLSNADNKTDVKECKIESKKLSKKLGIYNMFNYEDDSLDEEWNEEIKKETLKDMNEGIKQLEKMLPCVKKAKTMTDMMVCGKDNN